MPSYDSYSKSSDGLNFIVRCCQDVWSMYSRCSNVVRETKLLFKKQLEDNQELCESDERRIGGK